MAEIPVDPNNFTNPFNLTDPYDPNLTRVLKALAAKWATKQEYTLRGENNLMRIAGAASFNVRMKSEGDDDFIVGVTPCE